MEICVFIWQICHYINQTHEQKTDKQWLVMKHFVFLKFLSCPYFFASGISLLVRTYVKYLTFA